MKLIKLVKSTFSDFKIEEANKHKFYNQIKAVFPNKKRLAKSFFIRHDVTEEEEKQIRAIRTMKTGALSLEEELTLKLQTTPYNVEAIKVLLEKFDTELDQEEKKLKEKKAKGYIFSQAYDSVCRIINETANINNLFAKPTPATEAVKDKKDPQKGVKVVLGQLPDLGSNTLIEYRNLIKTKILTFFQNNTLRTTPSIINSILKEPLSENFSETLIVIDNLQNMIGDFESFKLFWENTEVFIDTDLNYFVNFFNTIQKNLGETFIKARRAAGVFTFSISLFNYMQKHSANSLVSPSLARTYNSVQLAVLGNILSVDMEYLRKSDTTKQVSSSN